MTPVVRWFRNLRERLFGSYFDGPEPPQRLAQMVIAFAQSAPHATRLDWAIFCIDSVKEAYRAGWTRGFEYTERDPDEREILRRVSPETLAFALDPDWQWSPELTLNGIPKDEVTEYVPADEEQVERMFRMLREVGHERGGADRGVGSGAREGSDDRASQADPDDRSRH